MLLIDEVDRADEEFEAFLLEVLSEFQVTIPEIGTIKATHPPYVILTSNRVRELSDALRRRCLYLWIDFPGFDKEVRIVMRKVPGVNERPGPADLALHGEPAHASGSPRCRAWPRPSTGPRRWPRSTPTTSTRSWSLETLGCVLKDADDVKRFKRELTSSGLKRFVAAEG